MFRRELLEALAALPASGAASRLQTGTPTADSGAGPSPWNQYLHDDRNTSFSRYAYPIRDDPSVAWTAANVATNGFLTTSVLTNGERAFCGWGGSCVSFDLETGRELDRFGYQTRFRGASPVVLGDRVLVPNQHYQEADDTNHMTIGLYDVATGETLWERDTRLYFHRTPPVVHDGTVYFLGVESIPLGYSGEEDPRPLTSRVYALDLADGSEKWVLDSTANAALPDGPWDLPRGPIRVADRLYVSTLRGLVEITLDGRVVDVHDVEYGELYAAHGNVYVNHDGVHAYDRETMERRWKRTYDADLAVSSVVLDPDSVYVTAVPWDQNGWRREKNGNLPRLYRADPSGRIVWEKELTNVAASMIGVRDRLYVGTANEHEQNKLIEIEKESGHYGWTHPIDGPVHYEGGITPCGDGLLVPIGDTDDNRIQLVTGTTASPDLAVELSESNPPAGREVRVRSRVNYTKSVRAPSMTVLNGSGERIHRSAGRSTNVTFPSPGRYTVRIAVRDENNRTVTATRNVTVSEPTATPRRTATAEPDGEADEPRGTSASGPGFGVGAAVGGLAASAGLLWKRVGDDE